MRPYTFKQIQTFMEVARLRSVSKAAECLFVTQPAVSMQIRQLSEGPCKTYLLAEHVGLKKGRIDLAVVSTAKYFIPMLLVRFGKLFQGIDLQLKIDNRENILGLLARNEADLVVMGRAPAHLDCEATPFAANPLAILAAPDHALVRRRSLPFSALADFGFVVREEGSGTRNHQAGRDGRHGHELCVAAHGASRAGQRPYRAGGHRGLARHGRLVRHAPARQEAVPRRAGLQGISDRARRRLDGFVELSSAEFA